MLRLETNTVYISADEKFNEEFRIVQVFDAVVVCIDLTRKNCMPYGMARSELEGLIQSGYYIQGKEPFVVGCSEDKLSKKDKAIRDRKYAAVFQLWKNKFTALDKHKRSKMIIEIASIQGMHPIELRRDFSRFLQRGMVPNALLSDNCLKGGRGKMKTSSDAKRGRPVWVHTGRGVGINITPEILKKIEHVVYHHYMPSKEPSYKASYNVLLRDSFSDQHYINGSLAWQVHDDSAIPTYNQFYYYARKIVNINKSETLIKRFGESRFDRTYRALLGDVSQGSIGPGFRYELDSTHSQVYVVSSLDNSLCIGEAIIYIIIDVVSRLVAGIYVGIEEPSWVGASMAIDNIVEDKVAFCKRFGIEITENQWPTASMPEVILADRGELKGKCPMGLNTMLGIEIENTAPYRGDMKPIVERHFGTLKDKLKKVPGAIKKGGKKRGEKDFRTDAVLTIKDLTKIVILEVLRHNRSVMEDYDTNLFGIHDTSLSPTPVNIWQWGLENLRCGLRNIDRDTIRIALMPKETATVLRQGIAFKGLFYGCDKAIREEWFIEPKNFRVDIAYDLRSTKHIYIHDEENHDFIVCDLLEKSSPYRDMSFPEYEEVKKAQSQAKGLEAHLKHQLEINTDEAVHSVVEEAKARDKGGPVDITDIKKHRKEERNRRRRDEAFEIGAQAPKIDNLKNASESARSAYEAKILSLLDGGKDENDSGYVLAFLQHAKDKHFYQIHLLYISTNDVDININRVHTRSNENEIVFTDEEIKADYNDSLNLLLKAVMLSSSALVFDNTIDNKEPLFVYEKINNQNMRRHNKTRIKAWTYNKLIYPLHDMGAFIPPLPDLQQLVK